MTLDELLARLERNIAASTDGLVTIAMLKADAEALVAALRAR